MVFRLGYGTCIRLPSCDKHQARIFLEGLYGFKGIAMFLTPRMEFYELGSLTNGASCIDWVVS